MIEEETIRHRPSRRVALVLLAMAALLAASFLLAAKPAHAETTFTVNSTGDVNDLDFPSGNFDGSSDGKCDVDSATSGNQCTLRAAIQETNLTSAADTINFNIPGTGVHTISPSSALPRITAPVTINGYSQPGASPNTKAIGTNAVLKIELSGANSSAVGNQDGLSVVGSDTVIRGLVINRFAKTDAIGISQPVAGKPLTNVRIEGNFLGTDPSGTQDLGNLAGVDLFNTSDSTVGGASPDKRNLISGSDFSGVFIEGETSFFGGTANNNRVQGNLIGTQKDGVQALGNGTEGVGVFGDAVTGNRILSNSIFSNGGLGIDLGDNGVTANDDKDPDTGPNNLQNFPDLASAKTGSKGTTIAGKLNSTPDKTFTLQFFSNPPGTNQGQKFIGKKSVTTDGSGNASFTFKTKKKVAKGANMTATATDSDGNTSEFSAPKEVV